MHRVRDVARSAIETAAEWLLARFGFPIGAFASTSDPADTRRTAEEAENEYRQHLTRRLDALERRLAAVENATKGQGRTAPRPLRSADSTSCATG